MKHLKFTYRDVMDMPVYERRFYIEMFKDEMDQQKERMDEMKKQKSSGGKGTRTTTVSGDALKNKMKSGEIK